MTAGRHLAPCYELTGTNRTDISDKNGSTGLWSELVDISPDEFNYSLRKLDFGRSLLVAARFVNCGTIGTYWDDYGSERMKTKGADVVGRMFKCNTNLSRSQIFARNYNSRSHKINN